MSAKLAHAIATGKVVVRRRTTGEVLIHFKTGRPSIVLQNRAALDLMKLGVTLDDVRKSNLRDLLRINAAEIVL
jgi:hypothetical protein